jgi:peroxiredoxin (alkyl hydroperoxide reductase subunit C)
MPEEFNAGCQRPAVKKISEDAPAVDGANVRIEKGSSKNMIKVGKPAPDFNAPAYIGGKFANVSLSEYKGQWISLCFYPGDFTFV